MLNPKKQFHLRTCRNIRFTLLSFSATVLSPAASLPKNCPKEKEWQRGEAFDEEWKNSWMLVGIHDFYVTFPLQCLHICMPQAMSSAPHLPMSTSPQKKSARMEVVWILDQSPAMKNAFAQNIFETTFNTWKLSSICRLLSIFDWFSRISQLPRMTTCLWILAQVFCRWNVNSVITSLFVNNDALKSRGEYMFKRS